MRRQKLALAGVMIAFLALIVSLAGIYSQLVTANAQLAQQGKIDSATFVLDLSSELNSAQYTSIMNAIENHAHTYSPLNAGFRDNQLEAYMSEFETIGDLYRDDVIAPNMAYDEFSYDAEKAYCNVDTQKDIARDRQEAGASTGTDAYWSGFQDMTTAFLNRDKYPCSSAVLDNQ